MHALVFYSPKLVVLICRVVINAQLSVMNKSKLSVVYALAITAVFVIKTIYDASL